MDATHFTTRTCLPCRTSPLSARPLTPEEDAIGDPDDEDDEIDDTLPSDLWF